MYGNFNLLLTLARTPYVKLASADDFWAPTMLADAMEQMQSDPSLVLCHPRAVLVDEDGREIRRYERPLHLMEDDPAVRFRRVLTELGLVNQLMGVMRTDAVRSMLPFMSYPPADTVFLAELSLYGKIMELPKFQYFRRFHEECSSWDRKSDAHQIKRVSAGNAPGSSGNLEVPLGARAARAPQPARPASQDGTAVVPGEARSLGPLGAAPGMPPAAVAAKTALGGPGAGNPRPPAPAGGRTPTALPHTPGRLLPH